MVKIDLKLLSQLEHTWNILCDGALRERYQKSPPKELAEIAGEAFNLMDWDMIADTWDLTEELGPSLKPYFFLCYGYYAGREGIPLYDDSP